MSYTKSKSDKFINAVWLEYHTNGRHDLPWRKTHDPYKILVSEVMLQQTQVERVKQYYHNFLKEFPTVESLATAPLADVLKLWQGLGYNRRAKMLHEAIKEVWKTNKGHFPKTVEELEKLPGIGHYTARAVAAFAYNQEVVFIETNIRTAVTHHFFNETDVVDDKEIMKILSRLSGKIIKDKGSREWYSALMDYGSHLKRSGININKRSKTYTKQSTFSGSARQARGALLKELSKSPQTKARLINFFGEDRKEQMQQQLEKLTSEGFIEKRGGKFELHH